MTEAEKKTKKRRTRAELAAYHASEAKRHAMEPCRDAVKLVVKAAGLLEDAATMLQGTIPTIAESLRANAGTVVGLAHKADTFVAQSLRDKADEAE